jgi:hypothetical protein
MEVRPDTQEHIEPAAQEAEQQGRLSQLGAFVGEHLPKLPPRLTAGLAVGALALGGAGELLDHSSEAAARPHHTGLRPADIQDAIVRRSHIGASDSEINVKMAKVDYNSLRIKDNCDVKNPPKYEEFNDHMSNTEVVFCGGPYQDIKHKRYPRRYYPTILSKIGYRAARYAGLKPLEYGPTTKIQASDKKAVIRYAVPSYAGAEARDRDGYVKKIVLTNHGSSIWVSGPSLGSPYS